MKKHKCKKIIEEILKQNEKLRINLIALEAQVSLLKDLIILQKCQ